MRAIHLRLSLDVLSVSQVTVQFVFLMIRLGIISVSMKPGPALVLVFSA